MRMLSALITAIIGAACLSGIESVVHDLQPEQKPAAKAAPVAQPEVAKPEKPKHPSSLTLESPDGKRRIVLDATNQHCGIWISGEKRDGSIAIYHGDLGNMVGVYSAGETPNLMSAAIGAYHGQGQLQICRPGEPPRWLTFRDLEKMQDPALAAEKAAKEREPKGDSEPAELTE